MNQEIKEQWTAVLPTYKQTNCYLRDSVGYCCLGVLCDLAEKAGIGRWELAINVNGDPMDTDNGSDHYYRFVTATGPYTSLLPKEVIEWAGVSSLNPDVKYGDVEDANLAYINDDGTDFNTIAQLIEEQL